MKFLAVLLLVFAFSFADDPEPENILIYHTLLNGYGQTVVTVAQNRWPSANVMAWLGWPVHQESSFNASLDNGTQWDIVILESWAAEADDINWSSLLNHYNNGDFALYVSSYQWNEITALKDLGNAMGVSGFTEIYDSVVPHYAWMQAHPVCTGVTNWDWVDPDIDVLNCRLSVSDALDITGWTEMSGFTGQAGICVANDGKSIISGFTPAYALSGSIIWGNILDFMWENSLELNSSTWAEIKTSF